MLPNKLGSCPDDLLKMQDYLIQVCKQDVNENEQAPPRSTDYIDTLKQQLLKEELIVPIKKRNRKSSRATCTLDSNADSLFWFNDAAENILSETTQSQNSALKILHSDCAQDSRNKHRKLSMFGTDNATSDSYTPSKMQQSPQDMLDLKMKLKYYKRGTSDKDGTVLYQ